MPCHSQRAHSSVGGYISQCPFPRYCPARFPWFFLLFVILAHSCSFLPALVRWLVWLLCSLQVDRVLATIHDFETSRLWNCVCGSNFILRPAVRNEQVQFGLLFCQVLFRPCICRTFGLYCCADPPCLKAVHTRARVCEGGTRVSLASREAYVTACTWQQFSPDVGMLALVGRRGSSVRLVRKAAVPSPSGMTWAQYWTVCTPTFIGRCLFPSITAHWLLVC